MKPKVIHNTEEHVLALRRIDELIDAEPGTPEGDDLDLWITLVELYEIQTSRSSLQAQSMRFVFAWSS
jgi:antitoxin component HigA of HigAB toxin-antitoxin module